jgi:hypothetical protein
MVTAGTRRAAKACNHPGTASTVRDCVASRIEAGKTGLACFWGVKGAQVHILSHPVQPSKLAMRIRFLRTSAIRR